MRRCLIAIAVVCCLAGCAGLWGQSSGFATYSSQARDLSEAKRLIAKGDNEAARRLLNDVATAPGVAGVTDEALFRLAILSLEKENDTQAVQALKHLQKDYPKSRWSMQAAPLADYLTRVDELKRQNKNLRNQNQTLLKENKELLQNIDKLKRLDLELEKKNR